MDSHTSCGRIGWIRMAYQDMKDPGSTIPILNKKFTVLTKKLAKLLQPTIKLINQAITPYQLRS